MNHFDDKGQPCECGWQSDEPVAKTAATIEELRQQKKLQSPEAQALLDHLDRRGYANEERQQKWIPALLNWVRKGHLKWTPNTLTFKPHPDSIEGNIPNIDLSPHRWRHMTDWMNSGHPTRQGVDIANTPITDIHGKVQEWDEDMEKRKKQKGREDGVPIHTYEDGWTLRNLTHPDHLKREGDAMGHCVGTYGGEVENGDLVVHSLRDPKGDPHVTYGIKMHENEHPGGVAYQVYGQGNSQVKDEYAERIKQYWNTQDDKETPLEEDYDDHREFYDSSEFHDWVEREVNKENSGDPTYDRHGFLSGTPHQEIVHPDWEKLLDDAIPEQYGGYYNPAKREHLDNIYEGAKRLRAVPDLAKDLEHFQEKADDNFFDYYHSCPADLYHPETGNPLNPSYRDAMHDVWSPEIHGQDEELREELESHGHPFNKEGYDAYGLAYEEAEQQDQEYYAEQDPWLNLVGEMYKRIDPHYNQQTGVYENEIPPQVQGTQKQLAKTAHRRHFHYSTGEPCRCPWGLRDHEHLGKTAAKIDWLRERPDMQTDQGKEFIKYLEERGYTQADKLLPWIVREWKKKRLHPARHYPYPLTYHRSGEQFDNKNAPIYSDGDNTDFDPNVHWTRGGPNAYHRDHTPFPSLEAVTTQKALEDMSKHRKGLDVMQHKAHELFPKVKDFLEWQKEQQRPDLGEVVHRFGDGWTVRRLQNAEEARIEGQDMGHCVGGYGNHIERGSTFIASLRDEKNLPHATIELTPDHWRHPETGDTQGRGQEGYLPRVGPSSSVEQFYGKQDAPPLPEYKERMDEWLAQHDLKTGEAFEPWWDEYYEVDAARTYDELINRATWGHQEDAPDDYHSAHSDAYEHNMEGPDLYPNPPDWHSILDSLLTETRGYGQNRTTTPLEYDPEKGQETWELANARTLEGAESYHEGGWGDEGANLEYAVKDIHDDCLHQFNQQEYPNLTAAKAAWDEDHRTPLVDHMMSMFDPAYQPVYQQYAIHPNQGLFFDPRAPGNTFANWPEDWTPLTQEHFGSTKGLPPLYYRWTFDPANGVALSSNSDDHPSEVAYHGQQSDGSKIHGYAYEIGGGWRLTDWEHQPIEDPYVVSSVVKALGGNGPGEPRTGSWEPLAYDWERTHYALPQGRVSIS